MAQLANANLLDDSVANSSSLKTERLNKTAQKAINPKPRDYNEERVVEKRKEEYNNKKVVEQEVEIDDDFEDDYEQQSPSLINSNSKIYSNTDKESEEKDNKILGMKPVLFYGLLALGVAVGGYFIYKKFIKNKKTIDVAPNPTPSVDVPTPTTNIGNG
jgi:hypothetical protein